MARARIEPIVAERVRRAIAGKLGLQSRPHWATTFDELDIKPSELALALSVEFDIVIPTGDIAGLKRVQDMTAYIRGRCPRGALRV